MSKKTNAPAGLKTPLSSKVAIFIFYLLILSSTIRCANMQQPTGGPRDSIAPVLLHETPPNLTTKFSARKIVLNFDEFIKLNNVTKEISISPDMETLPDFQVKRRALEIELPNQLEENTTYVINFGEAIADNNEGNAFKNYSYVFSTGDEIDSLNISGQVINALTNEPEIQISVILIPVSQDTIFGKKKANIFATTDSSGHFELRYLREDQYRIYALKEQNNDRIYNSPDEWIGFISDSIALTKDTMGIRLWTSKQVPDVFRTVERQIDRAGKVWFTFNRPLEQPRIVITDPAPLDATKVVEFTREKDSVNLWLNDMTFDSLKVQVFDRDSLLDSILVRRPKNDKYDRQITVTNNLDRNRVNRITHLQFQASTPLSHIDRSKIILMDDSVKQDNFQLMRDSIESRKFIIRYNWKPKRNYELILEKDALRDPFEHGNETHQWAFTLEENEKFGDIVLHLTVPDTSIQYLVEVIDEKKETIYRKDVIRHDKTLTYKNFPEGKYMLRIIYDHNGNGRWDPGNLSTLTQPERVWYYDKTFIIRPNWEQQEKINIPEIDAARQIIKSSASGTMPPSH